MQTQEKNTPYYGKVLALAFCLFCVNTLFFNSGDPTPPEPQFISLRAIKLLNVQALTLLLLVVLIRFAKKEMVWPFYFPYLVPVLIFTDANRGIYWSIIWFVFGIIPLFELVVHPDKENPTPEEEEKLKKEPGFKYATMLWVPLQLSFLLWACYAVSVWNLSTSDWFFLSVSVGFATGGLGINISHELIHKDSFLEKFLGKILLVSVCYGHWYGEHLWGHHKFVSTPYDAATARHGENLYSFLPRSIIGGIRSSWHLEQERSQRLGYNFWSYRNHFLSLSASSALLAGFLWFFFGKSALGLFIVQSLTAFLLLEIVNYIEHYGLSRDKVNTATEGIDQYEAVTPMHSWNADASVTNFFLFKLQRHSDHHAYAARRYQILRSFEAAPQMPTGYAGMITLALFPPVWFYVMDPKVNAWKENQRKAMKDCKLNKCE